LIKRFNFNLAGSGKREERVGYWREEKEKRGNSCLELVRAGILLLS